MRRLENRAVSLILALALGLTCAFPAAAEGEAQATASTVSLMKTEGEVAVTNSRGKELTKRDRMRLYSGYHVETQESSYAWVNLDDDKLTKLDAVSEMELRKADKQLEVMLNAGTLYFNVTEPLSDNESLNIRTSTMIMGIRGTSGWVRVEDQWHSQVYILQGEVECSVTDPVSGETKTTVLAGGETAQFVVYEQEKPGDKCDIIRKTFTEESAGGFIQVELAPDQGHREKIFENSGLMFPGSLAEAEERLEEDQRETHSQNRPLQEEFTHQDHEVSKDPVWTEDETPPAYVDNTDDGGGDDTPSAPDPGPTPDPDPDPEPPAENLIVRTMPVADNEVDGWLAQTDITGVRLQPDPAGDPGVNTLVVDSGITVPAGKTLTLDSGVGMDIDTAQTFQVDGTATVNEQIRSQGAIVVRSGNTLNALGGIESENGSLETTASGRVVLGGAGMAGLGTVINAGTIQGDVTFSSGSFTNTGTHTGGTITCDSGGAAYTPEVHVNGGSVGFIAGGSGADITVSGGSVGEISNTDDGGDSITITGGTVDVLTAGMYTNVTISAGAVGSVTVAENTTLTMSGGSVGTGGIYQSGGSVSISAGTVSGPCVSTGTAGGGYNFALTNSGVLEEGLTLSDGATAILQGGTLRKGATARLNSELEVAGAEVHGGIDIDSSGSLVISSGAVSGEVQVLNEARISGGRLNDGLSVTGTLTATGGEIHQGSASCTLGVAAGATVNMTSNVGLYANSRDELLFGSGSLVFGDVSLNNDAVAIIYGTVGSEVRLRAAQSTLNLTAGEAGDVMVLQQDAEYSVFSTDLSGGTVDNPVTLDLNGHTLQLKNSGPGYPDQYLNVTGHYLIKGGAITADSDSAYARGIISITGGGSLVVDGGNYQDSKTAQFFVDSGSSLTVKGDAAVSGGNGATIALNGSASLIIQDQCEIRSPEGATDPFYQMTQVPIIVSAGDDGSIPTINMSGGMITQESNGPVIVWDTGNVNGGRYPPPIEWFKNNPLQGTIRAKTYPNQNNIILYFVNDRDQLESLLLSTPYSDMFETNTTIVEGYTVLIPKN